MTGDSSMWVREIGIRGGYNSNWGFGLRLMVLNNPLRLDFGIPITTDPFNADDGNEFNFNFGTRF